MAGNTENGGRRPVSRWRMAAWGAGAAIVLLPLVAMQVTDEVKWGVADFAFASALVIAVGVTYELAARMMGSRAYRAAAGVALTTAFMLVWINAAVGIIGSEDNPANLMYWGILATGIVGAIVGRFRPERMARAMVATAFAQVLAGTMALIAGWGSPGSGPWEILGLTCFFTAPWLTSAWLFRKAARDQSSADAVL